MNYERNCGKALELIELAKEVSAVNVRLQEDNDRLRKRVSALEQAIIGFGMRASQLKRIFSKKRSDINSKKAVNAIDVLAARLGIKVVPVIERGREKNVKRAVRVHRD